MPLTDRLPRDVALSLHQEIAVDNFSIKDCDLSFYSLVRATLLRMSPRRVLDFGAGRNAYVQDFDPSTRSILIKDLRNLGAFGAEVTAVDVDDAVLTHPSSGRQMVIDFNARLPFEDEYFDVIVSDYVFEHIEHQQDVANELQRVLRAGGRMLVRTPNKYGYLKIISSFIPNNAHVKFLKHAQPHRKSIDTFPTYYRLNSLSDIKKAFSRSHTSVVTDSWEPAYFFGKKWLYKVIRVIHKLLPSSLGTASVFIIEKIK